MRDGNEQKIKEFFIHDKVVSLPMRDGNAFWTNSWASQRGLLAYL